MDRHRIADNKPYVSRTHDAGKTWQNAATGTYRKVHTSIGIKEDPQKLTGSLLDAALRTS